MFESKQLDERSSMSSKSHLLQESRPSKQSQIARSRHRESEDVSNFLKISKSSLFPHTAIEDNVLYTQEKDGQVHKKKKKGKKSQSILTHTSLMYTKKNPNSQSKEKREQKRIESQNDRQKEGRKKDHHKSSSRSISASFLTPLPASGS